MGVTRGFTIYNDGTLPLQVGGLAVSGEGFSIAQPIAPTTINPGTSGAFRVRLQSCVPGPRAGRSARYVKKRNVSSFATLRISADGLIAGS